MIQKKMVFQKGNGQKISARVSNKFTVMAHVVATIYELT